MRQTMLPRKPEHYACQLFDGRGYAGEQRRRVLRPTQAWRESAKSESEKLYVVKHSRNGRSEFVYVGRTDSSMRVRMYRGLNARKYPYQWRNLPVVDLYVRLLPGLTEKDGEAVEAELVYLIRHSKHKWPTHQNEIHFRHKLGVVRPELKRLAQGIYADLKKK